MAIAVDRAKLPNFFIIGAPKSGTTALFRMLAEFDDIYMSPVKEPGFFSSHMQYARGLKYYSETFFATADAPARGEATPWYLYHSVARLRIRELLSPEAWRFLVVLRDPVQRAYSMYQDQVRLGIEDLSFPQSLEAEGIRTSSGYGAQGNPFAHQYVECGRYAKYLAPWLRDFGPNVLVILHEDLLRAPEAVVARIRAFLGLEVSTLLATPGIHNRASGVKSMFLQRCLIRAVNNALLRRLGSAALPARIYRPVLDRVQAWNRDDSIVPRIDAASEAGLRALFNPDVLALQDLTGINLDGWLAR